MTKNLNNKFSNGKPIGSFSKLSVQTRFEKQITGQFMKATVSVKKEQYDQKSGDLSRDWYIVDATDMTLGRIATKVAHVLRGKHKPYYTPNVDTGDYVVVINADKIKLTGNKWEGKIYYHHTGYPGGIKDISAQNLMAKKPTMMFEKAVKGMMAKNKLNRKSLNKLKVYAGSEHPHAAHNPKPLAV